MKNGNGIQKEKSLRHSCRMTATLMMVAAVIFVIYSLNHPEFSWPWSNEITYGIYVLYAVVLAGLCVIAFKKPAKVRMPSDFDGHGKSGKSKKKKKKKRKK